MNPNGTRDKVFKIPISKGRAIDMSIHIPALRAQGLDLTPWASTYVLSSILYKLDIEAPRPKDATVPILELGAGVGLVGLVGSMVWHRHAVLTDLKPIVPGLIKNIELNAKALVAHEGSATAAELDWDVPESLVFSDGTRLNGNRDKAGIILAADTVYSEDHPPLLAQTILKWLAPGPRSRLVLTYPLRVAYLDQVRELWQLLEDGGLEAIVEGKVEAEELGSDSWDDERLCEWSVWKWKTLE